MTIYSIVFFGLCTFIFCFVELCGSKKTWIYSVFLAIIMAAIISLRGNTLPDTKDYTDIFLATPTFGEDCSLSVDYQYFEIGYVLWTKFFKTLFGNNAKFFFFLSTLFNSLVWLYITYRLKILTANSTNKILKIPYCISIAIYFSYYGIWYNAVVIRQGIALSFLLLMVIFVLERKRLRAILSLIIAVLFHKIAILGCVILLILIFFPVLKKQTYYILCFILPLIGISNIGLKIYSIVGSIIGNVFRTSSSFSRFAYYIDNMEYGQYSKTNLFFYLLLFFFLYYNIEHQIYYKILNIYIVGIGLTFFLEFVLLSYRITDIFLPVSMMLLFLSLGSSKASLNRRFVFQYGVIFALFAIMLIRVFRP